MAGQFSLCAIHLKSSKFFCFQPCSCYFCADCAVYHRNHFIRDLVTCPQLNEKFKLETMNLSINKNLSKISKLQEKSRGLFEKTKENQKLAQSKVEEEYEKVQKLLKERLLNAKETIKKQFLTEQQTVACYLEKLETSKKALQKKQEILLKMEKARPDQFTQDFLDFLNDFPDFVKPKYPEIKKEFVSLLKNPDLFYESI